MDADRAQRLVLWRVAIHYFIGQREAVRRDNQRDHHLQAIRTTVAAGWRVVVHSFAAIRWRYRPQRAFAAFVAMALRLDLRKLAARALPPLDAPSLDSATAAGFLVSFGNGEPSIFSPIRSSTTERASRLGWRGRLGLLARVGMVRL
jgi:hypothetical protein